MCVWGRGDTNRQVTVVIKLLFQTWVSSKGGPSLWNRGSGLVSNHHKGLSTRSKPHRWQLLLGDEKSHPAAEDINLRDPSSPTGTCGSSSLAPCGPPPITGASSITLPELSSAPLWCPGIWAAVDMEACQPAGGDSLESYPDGERQTGWEEKSTVLHLSFNWLKFTVTQIKDPVLQTLETVSKLWTVSLYVKSQWIALKVMVIYGPQRVHWL